MLEDRHSNHGFTLVELAVTILVLGLILAFSIPTFRSISNSQQLKGTVENMAAQIRMAREKAIATGQQQTFHFFENSYDADYHIHNGTFIPASWSLANHTCSEVSMRGLPCSPSHQKDNAPKTASAWSAVALVP